MGSLQEGKGSACVKDADFWDCATRNYKILQFPLEIRPIPKLLFRPIIKFILFSCFLDFDDLNYAEKKDEYNGSDILFCPAYWSILRS
jgi:hypothetical protein